MKLLFCLLLLLPTLAFAVDTEPTNNTLNGADMLGLGVVNSATINPANDVDFFKFTINQPGVIRIIVGSVSAGIDMDYVFYNDLGISVDTKSYGDGENFVIDYLICNPGTYSFSLGDNEGAAAPYTVRVDLDATDIYECNNTLTTAKKIPLATNVYASINDENDNDYYKFDIAQPGVVKITLSQMPANIDMDFEFFNEAGISVASGSYGDGENFSVLYLLCNPGTYAFRLADNESNPDQYCVRVDFDITDVYECNNFLTAAKLVPLATNLYASIYPDGDQDFYKFNVTQPGVVKITLTNVPPNIDLDYEFYNELGISLGQTFYGDGENFVISGLLCNPGTYAFRLADNEGNAAQYSFRIDFDVTDIYECNQDLNSAPPISCNTPALASINPAGDVDCYKITLTQPDIVTVSVTNVPANLDLTVGLYGPAPGTNPVQPVVNGGTGASVTLVSTQTLPAGEYYVCITDNKANASQYKLTVNCPSFVQTIDPQLETGVLIYPNPTDAIVQVEIKADNIEGYAYTLSDPVGRVILSNPMKAATGAIEVGNLSPGLYFIIVETNAGRITKQFVKR